MSIKQQITATALLAVFAGAAIAPSAVFADKTDAQKRQTNKNNWRNLGAAGAAVAGYGLLKGDKTATILGAAGAAYSAKRYEDERKSQSQAKAARQRYHRTGTYTTAGRKYYEYQGHQYYLDTKTGVRHRVG